MYSRPHVICVAAWAAPAASAGLAGWAWVSLGQVTPAADAAVTTEKAPAAAMRMALDLLSWTLRCRDKGTFR